MKIRLSDLGDGTDNYLTNRNMSDNEYELARQRVKSMLAKYSTILIVANRIDFHEYD